MILSKIKYILLFIISINTSLLSQNTEILEAFSFTKEGRYQKAIMSFKSLDTLQLNDENKALWNFYLGYTYNLNDQQHLAYKHILKAKKKYIILNKADDVKDCNLQLLTILSHQNSLKKGSQSIINELENYLSSKNRSDPNVIFKIYKQLGSNFLNAGLNFEAKKIFLKSLSLSKKTNDSLQISFDYMNLGTVFKKYKEYDSALYYTQKALPYLKKVNDSLNISYNYNNQAEAFKYLKDYTNSLYYYYKADSIIPNKNKIKSKIVFYENIADLYEKTNDYKEAFLFTKKKKILEDSINDVAQNLAIEDYRTKYQTAEKEKQILVEQQKKKQNKNIAFGLGGGLIGVSLIGFLLYKNTKRKQHIAEQEREIEIQKKEKLLKDQELTTIDAMIEGQEKERQRLASDLHDSVGATLSAARLQFEHLCKHKGTGSLKNENELFDKTGNLLEEAYQEIRSMAHLKNSGVIATKGLLPAVQKLARNASNTNGLQIEVDDFGLTQKIEGFLEIAIFRVIQELITNIIKHAQATEATISITQHNDMLSIIVEDNGMGFEHKKTINKDGMGLSSIEKRVEYLEGNFEIDSTPEKGTSILIDIPI